MAYSLSRNVNKQLLSVELKHRLLKLSLSWNENGNKVLTKLNRLDKFNKTKQT